MIKLDLIWLSIFVFYFCSYLFIRFSYANSQRYQCDNRAILTQDCFLLFIFSPFVLLSVVVLGVIILIGTILSGIVYYTRLYPLIDYILVGPNPDYTKNQYKPSKGFTKKKNSDKKFFDAVNEQINKDQVQKSNEDEGFLNSLKNL